MKLTFLIETGAPMGLPFSILALTLHTPSGYLVPGHIVPSHLVPGHIVAGHVVPGHRVPVIWYMVHSVLATPL